MILSSVSQCDTVAQIFFFFFLNIPNQQRIIEHSKPNFKWNDNIHSKLLRKRNAYLFNWEHNNMREKSNICEVFRRVEEERCGVGGYVSKKTHQWLASLGVRMPPSPAEGRGVASGSHGSLNLFLPLLSHVVVRL